MSTILNARSPYYIKITPAANTVTSVTLSLYIYSGVFTTDKPATAQYILTKTPITGNNFVIYEISFVIVLSLFPPHSVYLRGPLRLNARHRRQHVAPCEQLAPERGGKEGIG